MAARIFDSSFVDTANAAGSGAGNVARSIMRYYEATPLIADLYITRMRKTALITGAARRIGAQIARTLHAADFNIAVHYHTNADLAEELIAELNSVRDGSAFAVGGDLGSATAPRAIIEQVCASFGGIDLLVNSASIYQSSAVDAPDIEQWQSLFDINVRGPYLMISAALAALRARRGSVINITDIYALRPQPGHPVYCASKAALLGLTKALALDLAPDIRVNAIAPGPILWAEKNDPSYKDIVLAKTPLARLGGAVAIADAVAYLAAADFVTGEVLHVDGGRQLHI